MESLRIEEALRLSEERLSLALDASDLCVWEYEVAPDKMFFSRHLGAMLGLSEGETPASREAWETLLHPDDLPIYRKELERHLVGHTRKLDVEYRVGAKDGAWRRFHTIGRADRDLASGCAVRISGTHRDRTEREQFEARVHLLDLAIDAATNAILVSDARAPDRPIVQVNKAFEAMTGYSAEEVIGVNCRFLQGTDRDQPELERLRAAVKTGSEASVLLRNYRKDGSLFWNNLRISPVRDRLGAVTHFVGIQTDVTELNYQVELELRANYDTLTGLANRNLLHDRLGHEIASSLRNGRAFGLLCLDLDRFKAVNDSLGRGSGDNLLKIVAQRLKDCVRDTDTVARLSGDEFAVLLSEIDPISAVSSVAKKILEAVEQPIAMESIEVFTHASIGACVFPGDGASSEILLKNAENSMHRAKQGGGNQICFYTEDLNRNALDRLHLESDLRRALAVEEFALHYQPRVELRSNRITSLEALIRWKHPEKGMISPASFIPLAEETGLIVPIGEWVLRTACAQMRRWRDAGYDELRVAVNLSPRQFRQPDLAAHVAAILAEAGLAGRHLELEITESVAMQDAQNTREVLQQLSDMGIELAIDDFGTGFSSLAYLKRFPIDCLKIDQSFVRGIPGDEDDNNIARAVIALSRSLRLKSIAEGVETEAQREFLLAEGCDEMQGYLFSRPKPAAELETTLASLRPADHAPVQAAQ